MALVELDLGNGRKVYRFPKEPVVRARSDLACPQIMKPFAEPVRSMADGKYYSDAGSLRRSYRADGNPRGIEFTEIGDAELPMKPPHKGVTAEECNQLLTKYEQQAASGTLPNLPDIVPV